MAKLSGRQLLALLDQAYEFRYGGDADRAKLTYQQAIDSGHRIWASEARFLLGSMLQEDGDLPGARAVPVRPDLE